jgi:mRNA interferase RelE/StbE
VASYSLEIKPSAQKELDAPDDRVFARIDRGILALKEHPRLSGCKKLKGYNDQWRIRVGDWRMIYTIDDAGHITITRVWLTAGKYMTKSAGQSGTPGWFDHRIRWSTITASPRWVLSKVL